MPVVSVVIPVYNIAVHLRQCLDSVVSQTLSDVEIICVDDGSTDDSPKILEEFAARDNRVRVITQQNAGPGAARNAGMKEATGTFLIFLDSDDWFERDFLERMVQTAKNSHADMVICKSTEFDTASGKELPSEWMLKASYIPAAEFSPSEIARHIFQFSYGWPWDKLYRTSFVREMGLKYPALPNSEDLVFVFQSLALANRIAILGKQLVHHRVNRKSSVSNSRHRDPEVPYQALSLLKRALIERGCYQQYEQSFLNWAMEFLIWNVANMGDSQAQKKYYRKLRQEWLPQMAFERYPRSYYGDRGAYAKYQLAKVAPYPVFSAIVKVYKACKQGAVER